MERSPIGSIRSKLFLLALLPLITTTGTFIVLFHFHGRNVARENFEQAALAQYLLIAKRTDYFFESQAEFIRAVAEIPAVQTGDPKEVLPVLRRIFQRGWRVKWDRMGFFDSQGRLYDVSGSIFQVSERAYFKQVMSGTPITGAVASLETKKPVLIAATPIYNIRREVIGGVIVSLNAPDIAMVIAEPIPASAHMLLAVDELDETVLTAGPRSDLQTEAPFIVQVSQLQTFGPLVNQVRTRSGFFETTYRDKQVLVYAARVPYLGWPLVLVFPTEAAYADIVEFEWVTLALLLIALLAVGLTVRFLSRSFLVPVTQLLEGFHQVGRGDLDTRLKSYAKDELGELTQSFNNMVLNLQRALARSEEEASERTKLLTIIERSPQAVGISEVDGAIFYLNPAGRELFGISNLDEEQPELARLFDAESQTTFHEVGIPHALRFGIWAGEMKIVTRDRSTVPVALTLVCHTEDHVPIYLSFVARDISKYKTLEGELRAALHEAENANVIKDAFLTTVSHELLTPLSTVAASLELLQDTCNDQKLVTLARKGADRLKVLFSRLFLFLDLVASKTEVKEERFSLQALVQQITHSYSDEASEKGLTLETTVDEGIWDARIGDKGKLCAALCELMANAVKFTSEGSVRLTVELLRDMKDRDFLRFTVHDTGVGISKENRDKIFQSFRQADFSLTRRYAGIGLGLALVRLTAGALNGELEIESQLGIGSHFRLDLVLKRALES